ncbi:MAG: rare lipoprotein A (peptidoglycan hydrolase) [Alphaproteobacteria bacterium]
MTCFSRLYLAVAFVAAAVTVSGCSMGLRGRTQSVADDRSYNQPYYAGRRNLPAQPRQYVARPQQTHVSPQSPRRAEARYYQRSRVSAPPRYSPPPVTPRPDERHAFAVPPRVERYAVQEAPPVKSAPAAPSAPVYERSGWSRWMGHSWDGHKTTSGEMFSPDLLTGAHDSLPLPSFVYVTNKSNGRTILIRVNDRVPAGNERVIIVSKMAAKLLDFRRKGRAKVDIQYAGKASPSPNGEYEEEFLRKQSWYRAGMFEKQSSSTRAARTPTRYPEPNYPRWDSTQR